MTDPIDLIEQLRSASAETRSQAVARLIEAGQQAVPALTSALSDPNAEVRAGAAEALATIADASTAEALVTALNDNDERVRARAAAGLARIGHPRGLDALIATLDDEYDLLHVHLSRSAYALMQIGPIALPALAPLLKHERESLRTQAIWIIREIVSNMPEAGDWSQLYARLGSYDPEAPEAERTRAAEAWISWIDQHTGGQP